MNHSPKAIEHIFVCMLFVLVSLNMHGQEPVYQLVWSDEFEGSGAINADNWHHQTLLPNGSSWYNGEIQHYTDRTSNSYVSNGTLKIVAKKETYTDQGVTKDYTSARLNSKFAFTYGKIEVRAKLPVGVGTWPAIWTLGQNIIEPGGYWSDTHGTTFWPACGEIDIMEHWGINQDYVQSAIHSPSSFGNTVNKGGQLIPGASVDYHIYTMEWTEDKITFSVDDVVHYSYEPSVQNSATWPFVENQYLLLNVAILPEIDPGFTESTMEIDYVRVYQEELLNTAEAQYDLFTVFPNPVKDTLNVRVHTSLIGARLTLYALQGNKLRSRTIEELESSLDLSSLPSGTYLINITKGDLYYQQKVVKR